MSKEQFVERVMSRLSSEYGMSLRQLAEHKARIEDAYETENTISEDELEDLFAGTAPALAKTYPILDEVSLKIVQNLEDEDEDEDDDEDEDEDDDEDDIEEDEDE